MVVKLRALRWQAVLLVVLIAGGVAFFGLARYLDSQKTVGERFREAMARHAELCASYVQKPGETTCDILELKPADPLATPEGRFAHSIKLPPPHDKPKEVWREGMSGAEYFKALCEAEAGEFIFRTVEGVEGILQLRPREKATDHMQMHLYAMEDPYTYSDWEAMHPAGGFVGPGRYRFFEMPDASGAPRGDSPPGYRRYSGYDGRRLDSMSEQMSGERRSRYGYIWRGMSRPNDRELGIGGGEVIVLDLISGEPVALKRGFARTGHVPNVFTHVWWMNGQVCPGDNTRLFRIAEFIQKALRPLAPPLPPGAVNASP